MAYQSLYRKYRSRDFSDLVGQQHITQTLANAISSGRVSHAYLFCGPRGTGKTSTARVLAKALNCLNGPTAEPCGVCQYCVSVRDGSAMDVVEIDAASNRNIDDMRQLREQVNYSPVELRYKFYIVDEVHQLTRDAFNAFLKTLEEPPPHVIFVLCTTDPHQLPATILSRCQRFDFHRIPLQEIVERLRWVVEQEGWTVEEEALALIARTANGGLRDALSVLDQAASYAGTNIAAQHVRDILGGIDLDLLLEHTDLVLQRDADGLFHLIDRIMSQGKDVPQMVTELIQHWRNLLRASISGQDALVEFTPEQRKQMTHQVSLIERPAIMRAITLLCEAENELRWNSQQRLLLELYSLRLISEDRPAVAAPPPTARPAPRSEPAIPRTPIRPDVPESRPSARFEPPVTPKETPSPAPPPTVAEAPAPAPAAGSHDWTLPSVKKAWPQFIEWLARSPKMSNLRERIVEKCWPASLVGDQLTLHTSSAFVREQYDTRPAVKQALEQCLQSHFKASFRVVMAVDNAAPPPALPTAPAAPPRPEPEPAPPPAEPAPVTDAAPENAVADRDVLGERVKQVFSGSREITE
ncbi:MAG TPA: DNA polymerase III subunit gamma/tau [Armatimonadota bacterium]